MGTEEYTTWGSFEAETPGGVNDLTQGSVAMVLRFTGSSVTLMSPSFHSLSQTETDAQQGLCLTGCLSTVQVSWGAASQGCTFPGVLLKVQATFFCR